MLNDAADSRIGLLLALDTSCDVCSVAALRHGELISEHTFRHGMHLSQYLTTHMDAVLNDAEAALADVDAFAVGIGPGSFTGTRIGVMTVKTLAWLQQRPVYGIGGLEALALEWVGGDATVVPILPCRAGTVYAACYRFEDGWPKAVFEPAAWSIVELADRLISAHAARIVFCGEAVSRYRDDLSAALTDAQEIGFGIARFPRAAHIGALARRHALQGEPGQDALVINPHYISPPPITLPKPKI